MALDQLLDLAIECVTHTLRNIEQPLFLLF